MKAGGLQRAAKRCMDLVGAVVGMILFGPVMAVVAALVFIKMGRPVLFRQVRPGLNERPFTLYKLTTMRDARGHDGRPLADAERITPLGRALRRWSLDELPQFWNVLRGDMSLVGPRPLLMEYLDRYTPEQRRRHEVRPGITGWAQIGGRNAITWEEKFRFDVWYVDNWTLRLDIVIILKTAFNVFRGKDISQRGQATMEKFTGTVAHSVSGNEDDP